MDAGSASRIAELERRISLCKKEIAKLRQELDESEKIRKETIRLHDGYALQQRKNEMTMSRASGGNGRFAESLLRKLRDQAAGGQGRELLQKLTEGLDGIAKQQKKLKREIDEKEYSIQRYKQEIERIRRSAALAAAAAEAARLAGGGKGNA